MAAMEDFTFYESWMPKHDADYFMGRCLSEIPWGKKKWSLFYTLPQLAYYYDEKERKERRNPVIEDIINIVETAFNTSALVVWCNLFNDGNHHIDWHQDQYGYCCFVLSLGSTRALDWRLLKTKEIKTYYCKHGDLYYFNPQWDKIHEHRIPSDSNVKEKRLSFVIFTQPPFSGRAQPS